MVIKNRLIKAQSKLKQLKANAKPKKPDYRDRSDICLKCPHLIRDTYKQTKQPKDLWCSKYNVPIWNVSVNVGVGKDKHIIRNWEEC